MAQRLECRFGELCIGNSTALRESRVARHDRILCRQHRLFHLHECASVPGILPCGGNHLEAVEPEAYAYAEGPTGSAYRADESPLHNASPGKGDCQRRTGE